MKKSLLIAVLFAGLLVSGCYHATVETGKPASNDVIEKPFALSFVYGLIPPPTVNAAEKCANGVSKVETKISFLNGLVSAITFSIVTPMNITVTCAEGGMTNNTDSPSSNNYMTLSKDASLDEVQETYRRASDMAAKNGDAVYVHYE